MLIHERVAAELDLELWWRHGFISDIAGGLFFFDLEKKPQETHQEKS